jgi:FtsZ-interacting cell division protein ZipA
LLIRITWLLVLVGLGLVIGGFLTTDSNVLLILAIAVEIAAIILVLASWARRAREASAYGYEEEVSFADDDTGEAKEEELYAALEADEEFAVGGRRAASSTRRPARKKTGSPAGRSTAKAKPAASARKTTAKSTSKAKGAAKPKPTRKAKPKAQGTTTRPKAKQPRPRPPSASP